MSTTYKELYQRAMTRIEAAIPGKSKDGIALLSAKEAVNSACKALARIQNFDELIVLDTTNAATVASTSTYHIVNDWGLTRPKDILSLKYMDTSSSRKLLWVSPREVDTVIPYPAMMGENLPVWYTTRGLSVELFPTPNAAKSIYINYVQWPAELVNDSDLMVFPDDVDDVLVSATAAIALSIIRGVEYNSVQIVQLILQGTVIEERNKVDRMYVARPFNPGVSVVGEYWKDPMIRRNP